MKTVSIEVGYEEKALRIEILVRIIYAIIGGIVCIILEIIGAIAWVIQLLAVLFAGRRVKSLHNFLSLVLKYQFRLSAYLNFLTDEHPPLVPED